jgi:integrase
VHIKTRVTKAGAKRYLVYYRRGGRAFPLEYAGSFAKKELATGRRDLIAGELAAGRDPRELLAQLAAPPVETAGLDERWDAYTASRTDVAEETRGGYRDAKKKWLPILGEKRDPHTITADEVIAGVAKIRDELSPATAGQYLSRLRLVLDYCDVDPNPARSKKVKRPRVKRVERSIPSNEQWQAIRGKLRKRSLLIERLQEACAFRVSEAAGLEWGDFDFIEGMVRVRREITKTDAGRRWVPVPPDLLDAIEALTPLEDRRAHDRVLGVRAVKAVLDDLGAACVIAGVPVFTTHALRHRRISLWIRHGIDEVQIARWAGHSRASESQDTYGHVVLDPRGDEWRDFWLETYESAGRVPREAPVRHEEDA